MRFLDYAVIAVYFAISLGIAFYFSRRSGGSTEDFFTSGKKLPWWIAGTTMVATTFAADTPLAVTELVAKNGIAGNWLWWNMVAGNVFTIFFFARLWRRAGVMTDVEFIELRYSGRSAAVLRGFKAVYLGVFMNSIIMGWVNVALAEILKIIFNAPEDTVLIYVFSTMLVVGIYSAMTGLSGISYTDVFQFITAMTGCIILAFTVLGLPEIGGIAGLKASLPAGTFNFFPEIISAESAAVAGIMGLSFSAFIAHIGIQWWASWYPGSEPGGGGYIAQRMIASRTERDSQLATLWFSIAHYALRPWPWIITALCVAVLYPQLKGDAAKTGFILAMKDHLPAGLLGLLAAAFLAAYMSTISTHLNWGTSYIVNDLYKRFIRPGADEKHYVAVSRATVLILTLVSSLMILVIKSISGAWSFIIECGAGLGLVLILRWYWWRVNAWSEISAMIAPFGAYAVSSLVLKLVFPQSLFFIVGVTTVVWVAVTFITKPVDRARLEAFNTLINAGGPGWRGFEPGTGERVKISAMLLDCAAGIILVYSALFGIGKIIFMDYLEGVLYLAAAATTFIFIIRRLKR